MADFTERLDQIVGGLAVVVDDQQAHLSSGCGHANSFLSQWRDRPAHARRPANFAMK
jgi:hypothetical protein